MHLELTNETTSGIVQTGSAEDEGVKHEFGVVFCATAFDASVVARRASVALPSRSRLHIAQSPQLLPLVPTVLCSALLSVSYTSAFIGFIGSAGQSAYLYVVDALNVPSS
jgi:hypothetical protein